MNETKEIKWFQLNFAFLLTFEVSVYRNLRERLKEGQKGCNYLHGGSQENRYLELQIFREWVNEPIMSGPYCKENVL